MPKKRPASRKVPKKRAKTRNDGKELERLVAEIERHVFGSNFTVEGQRVGNESEFDIVISGMCGSVPVKYLIECRDRTQAASGTWIEQLMGRKQLSKFQEVIAVSASGFGKPAIAKAKKGGIILRTVTRLSDIGDDFKMARFTIKSCLVTLLDNKFYIIADSNAELGLQGTPHDSVEVKHPDDTQYVLFYSLLQWVITQPNGWDWKNAKVGIHTVKFTLPWPLDLRIPGKVIRTKVVGGLAQIKIETFPCQALQVALYSDNGRVIGQKVDYKASTPSGDFTSSIVQIPAGGDKFALKSPKWQIPPSLRHFDQAFYPKTCFETQE